MSYEYGRFHTYATYYHADFVVYFRLSESGGITVISELLIPGSWDEVER